MTPTLFLLWIPLTYGWNHATISVSRRMKTDDKVDSKNTFYISPINQRNRKACFRSIQTHVHASLDDQKWKEEEHSTNDPPISSISSKESIDESESCESQSFFDLIIGHNYNSLKDEVLEVGGDPFFLLGEDDGEEDVD